MHLPDPPAVAAVLVALTPAVAIGWAIGAALDRRAGAARPHVRSRARKPSW
jgi:hypothetical protein